MNNPEMPPEVGGEDESQTHRSDLLDYLAKEGVKAILLAAKELRTIGGLHPEFLTIPERVRALQQLDAHIAAALHEAGYAPEEVKRLYSSPFTAPHDPLKPRTNR